MSRKRTLYDAHGEALTYNQFRQALAILCWELRAAAPVNGVGKLVNHRARRIPRFDWKGNIVLATTYTEGKGVALESPHEHGKPDLHCVPAPEHPNHLFKRRIWGDANPISSLSDRWQGCWIPGPSAVQHPPGKRIAERRRGHGSEVVKSSP